MTDDDHLCAKQIMVIYLVETILGKHAEYPDTYKCAAGMVNRICIDSFCFSFICLFRFPRRKMVGMNVVYTHACIFTKIGVNYN